MIRLECRSRGCTLHWPPNFNAVLRTDAAGGLDVSMLRQAMQLIGSGRRVETEASGNVTLETVR